MKMNDESVRTSEQDSTIALLCISSAQAYRADQIVMMHQGAVVEYGTHTQLMEAKGRYYALYRQQESE